MKGREAKPATTTSADLLVCFPSRARLSLMPKPMCSPARASDSTNRRQHHHHKLVKKFTTRGGGGHPTASPLLWAKTKSMGHEISEPSSPKVTCAGQIKVRHKTGPCKNWQSVMEEIERIHNDRKNKKKPNINWVESFGFKKEIMQFLTCLRSIRFDFRCFRAFPETDITTDDEDEEEEEEFEDRKQMGVEEIDENESSRAVFTKWFMVLEENQKIDKLCEENRGFSDDHSVIEAPIAPPPNALLLMRCRSAPAKSWLEYRKEEEEDDEEKEEIDEEEGEDRDKEVKKSKSLKMLMDEENSNMVMVNYDSDCYRISSEIVKETWVVGGLSTDSLSRSRSWKRW